MVFGGNSSNDVEIRVRVNSEGVIQTFDQLGNQLSEVKTASEGAASGFSKTQASLVSLSSTVQLAKDAFALLQGAASFAIDSISRGSEVDDISTSFQNLAREAGASGDALLNKLNSALANTIPNIDLMKQANELLLGGLKPDQIELVAKAARTLGETTGTDAAEGMNQLADSLLRGNDRALKTLGITVDNSKAMLDFAKANNVAVESLSEAAKVEAIREASLKALAEQQERLGDVTVDAGDRIQQVNKVVTDTFDELYQKIASDEGVNAALDEFVRTIKGIDVGQLAKDLAELGTALISFISDLVKFGKEAIKVIREVRNSLNESDTSFNAGANAISEFLDVGGKFKDFGKNLLSAEIKKINELLGQQTPDAAKKAIESYAKLKTEIGQAKFPISAVEELKLELFKIRDATREANKEYGPFTESQNALQTAAEELTNRGIKPTKDALTDTTQTLKKAKDELKKLESEGLKAAKEEAEELDKQLSELAKNDWATKLLEDIEKAKQVNSGFFGDFLNNLFGGEDKKNPELIERARHIGLIISESIVSGIADTLTLALDGASGADLRQAGVNFLTQMGKDLLPEDLKFLGPVIDVGGKLLGKAVEHIFGGEDAGTTARKAADKFFADAFDANRLQVIIDGQLKEISDLVFKGDTLFGGDVDFTDGTFSNFLASLPGEAQAAFNGVGLAFEELLGIGEDVGGQLAAVFANNVGGSLNNLQLLVGATGKSFEELRGFVVEAFLDGKISALEAQTALNGLAQVAQKGIPDAIGATIQAFDNLKAAGTKGGRALIDALQDIGYEAKELGLRDFPALQAQLAASGRFTQQEIEQLFAALRDNGINSIEQLTGATNEQLIPVLSQLQAQEFPFAEAANSASELITQINELPNEKTLTFNIKTNFDANTQTAVAQGYTPAKALQQNVSIP